MKPVTHGLSMAALLTAFATPAAADLNVKFVESAPKDWFAVTNNGSCTLASFQLNIDLSNSAGKLIFDTTASGAGVEVFQPFEVKSGSVSLVSSATVQDGDQAVSVLVENLQPGETASFTIDVDDTLTNSELGMIRVSKSEISGSAIKLVFADKLELQGQLDRSGQLTLAHSGCV